jgi:hypothetical protein
LKIEAQQSAAKEAYTKLVKTHKLEEIVIHQPPVWIALIALEYIRPTLILNKPIIYYIFTSSSISTDEYKSPNTHIIKTNDASMELTMAYYAGKLTKTNNITNYLILTYNKQLTNLRKILEKDEITVTYFGDVETFEDSANCHDPAAFTKFITAL